MFETTTQSDTLQSDTLADLITSGTSEPIVMFKDILQDMLQNSEDPQNNSDAFELAEEILRALEQHKIDCPNELTALSIVCLHAISLMRNPSLYRDSHYYSPEESKVSDFLVRRLENVFSALDPAATQSSMLNGEQKALYFLSATLFTEQLLTAKQFERAKEVVEEALDKLTAKQQTSNPRFTAKMLRMRVQAAYAINDPMREQIEADYINFIDTAKFSTYAKRFDLGSLYLETGNFEDALAHLLYCEQEAHENNAPYEQLGEAYYQLSDYDQALKHFSLAKQAHPEIHNQLSPEHIRLAQLYLRTNEYDRVLDLLQDCDFTTTNRGAENRLPELLFDLTAELRKLQRAEASDFSGDEYAIYISETTDALQEVTSRLYAAVRSKHLDQSAQ